MQSRTLAVWAKTLTVDIASSQPHKVKSCWLPAHSTASAHAGILGIIMRQQRFADRPAHGRRMHWMGFALSLAVVLLLPPLATAKPDDGDCDGDEMMRDHQC